MWILAIACDGATKDPTDVDWDCDDVGPLSRCEAGVSSDDMGRLSIEVDIDDGSSFLLTALGDSPLIAVEQLRGPDGDVLLDYTDWYGHNRSLTLAFFEGEDTVLNWPIRESDGPLQPGTYEVDLGLYNDAFVYQADTQTDVVVDRGFRGDFTDGEAHVLVVYADGLESDPDVQEGTEAAIGVWREVWAAFGIDLVVDSRGSTLDSDLPWPGFGDDEMQQASSLSDGTEIVVVIGETIDGGTDYLGVSGNVPGSLIPTGRTGTVVSWLASAGVDGVLSSDEIQIYGETLAHEVGHYVGLFHPVEDGYAAWDALDDTPECNNQSSCEDILSTNLMYPWPVCGFASCVSQSELTNDQQGVMHRYTGIY